MESADGMLLERWAGRRDAEAFQALVQRHSGMVFSTCRRILGDASRAEDVTQECFLKLAMGDTRPGPFLGPWLHRMATRRCLDALRAEKRRSAREARYSAQAPQSVELRVEALEPLIDQALAELPDRMRLPIALHYLEGLSQEDVARQLNVPRRTVSYRISTGLERMGSWLQRRGVTAVAGVLATRLSDLPTQVLSDEFSAQLSKLGLTHAVRALPRAPWLKTAVTSYGTGALVAVIMATAGFVGVSHLIAAREQAAASAVKPQIIRTAAPQKSSVSGNAGDRDTAGRANTPKIATGVNPAPKAGAEPLKDAALEADAGPCGIAGSVVDEEHQPIADAVVRVVVRGEEIRVKADSETFSVETDSKGLFQLAGLPGRKELEIGVTATGYNCPFIQSIKLDPGRTLEDCCIVLAKGISFYGKVIGRNGNPAAGAFVVSEFVQGPSRIGGGGSATAQTDPTGRFQLGFREEAKAVLRVLTQHDGEAIFKVDVQPDGFVELRMPAPAAVRGRVTRSDGKPATEVTVVLRPTAEEANGFVGWYSADTDADGRYELASLPPEMEYVATVQDSEPRELTNEQPLGVLAAGATKTFDIRLGKPARIHGTITGERTGRPQKGARIGWVCGNASDDSVTVGEDGSYELELFEPGTYVVYAIPACGDWAKDCRQKYGRAVEVSLGSGQSVDFRLPDAFSMAVHVVDGQGKPISGATVSPRFALGPNSEYSYSGGQTDATGRYRYAGFPPGYVAWLEVKAPGPPSLMGADFSAVGAARCDTAQVEGAPGVDYPEETVVLYGASGLRGVALTAEGQPLASRSLSLNLTSPGVAIEGVRSGEISANKTIKTDSTGAFLLRESVPATTLSLTFLTEHEDGRVYKYEAGQVDCQAGQVIDLGSMSFQPNPSAKAAVVSGGKWFMKSSDK
jgi:RNA polymerase sigma-70 factor (ECF subfamily)